MLKIRSIGCKGAYTYRWGTTITTRKQIAEYEYDIQFTSCYASCFQTYVYIENVYE